MSRAPVVAEGLLRLKVARVGRVVASGLLVAFLWTERAAAEVGAPSARGPRSVRSVLHGVAVLSLGRGLRFNNPYRLATPLGDSAESVSLSASYLDLNLGVLSSPSAGVQHGAALSGVVALQGISQFAVTPSYLVQLSAVPSSCLALRGRLGVPIVVTPDTTLGLEAAFGPNLGVAFGLGLMAEIVGTVFFGAGTEERSITTIPMLSLQVGVLFDQELWR